MLFCSLLQQEPFLSFTLGLHNLRKEYYLFFSTKQTCSSWLCQCSAQDGTVEKLEESQIAWKLLHCIQMTYFLHLHQTRNPPVPCSIWLYASPFSRCKVIKYKTIKRVQQLCFLKVKLTDHCRQGHRSVSCYDDRFLSG